MSAAKAFVQGIFSSNPVFRLALGLVPVLGITHLAWNGVYMGVLTTAILLGAVLVKIVLEKVVSREVQVFVDLATVAVLTIIAYRLLGVYQPDVLVRLGIYFPLIMVNSFVFQRLNQDFKPVTRIADALGMGIGYTLALVLIGIVREFIGLGQVFGISVLNADLTPFSLAATVPGGLVILGLMMAFFNLFGSKGGQVNE